MWYFLLGYQLSKHPPRVSHKAPNPKSLTCFHRLFPCGMAEFIDGQKISTEQYKPNSAVIPTQHALWWRQGILRRVSLGGPMASWGESRGMGTWEMMVHWVRGGKDSKGGNLSLDHKKLKNSKTYSNTHTHMHARLDRQTTDRHRERQSKRDRYRYTQKDYIYPPLFWLKVGKQLIKFADQWLNF